MYKSERNNKKAAKGPKERNMPFSPEDIFRGASMAQNDPVGKEIYASNPYERDRRLNWIDRN